MITRNKAHAALDQNIFVRLGFDHLYDDYPLAEKWKEKPRRWTVKELQAPIKAIKEKMKDCICPGGKDLYERKYQTDRSLLAAKQGMANKETVACSWRDQEFARADNMEDYISYLNTRYGANKWHEVLRGIRYKGIDPRGNVTSETEITADLRESQRQPNSRMTELGKVMYNPGVKFAFIKHSPRRSFWKAFAHSNPQFGTENSWPVVQWQIRAWMTYIEGLALSPRRRLYAAFEYNIPDTPGDGTLWDEANYSMLYRITRADLPVPLFFAQIVADFYCIEVVVIMPMRDDGVYDAKAIHPIVVRGEPCGRQVILHLDENGEWHSVKPLVRIPRHFRMKVPDAIYDQDVEDIETISTAPLDHLIRCPFVKYPITSQGAEPINSIDATKQYAQLQAFYLDAPFLTQPHFGTVTYEMVQWLRRFDLAVIQDPLRPILLPEDAYQGGDKIPADVREDREAEDVA